MSLVQQKSRYISAQWPSARGQDIAKDLDGVPSWSSHDRVARKHGLTGDGLLRAAERAVADAG